MPNRPWPRKLRLDGDLYSDPERVFHIVMRAFPGTSPFVDQVRDTVWSLLLNERERSSVELFAACLLPDHLHLLVSPRDKSVPVWANSYKAHVTKSLRPIVAGAVWQPSYFDRVMRSSSDFQGTVRYIIDNPVEAGFVREPGEWPWIFVADGV